MGLGSRGGSRHETAKTAGVNPEDFWAFRPGQTVMTTDGFPGKVQAVLDGPFQGSESYDVVLANGMGGGLYTEGQLTAFNDVTASHENTASIDYPELSEVLAQRPDIGRYPESTMAMLGSVQKQADAGICENGHLTWDGNCASCRNASGDQNHMVINEGDHRPDRERAVKQSASGLPPEPAFDEHPAFGAWGEPSQHDGCTVCGNSGHDTHQHVDPGVEDEIEGLFTPADTKHLKAQPGLPTPYSAWQGDPNDDSPYNPGNYGPECDLCGEGHETFHHDDEAHPDGPSLKRGYAMFAQALRDPSFAFHFTAAWKDVRNKARRIRAEGGVHLTESRGGFVVAQVKGDHGTYESVIMRVPGTQKVGQWDCGCKWAKYHWGAPDDFSRFAGRMCSHVMALNFEAQSRGMFGREVSTDEGAPPWLTKGDMTKASSLDIIDAIDYAPVHVFAALAIQGGDDPIEVLGMLRLIAAVSSPFGEPGPSSVPGPTPGGTSLPDPNANPASAGFLTGADPRSWGQQTPGDLGDRTSAQHTPYDDSVFDADIVTHAVIEPKEAWVQMLVPLVRAIAPKLIKSLGPAAVEHEIGKHKSQEPGDTTPAEGPGGEHAAETDPMGAANNFANNLKSWTDRSKAEGDRAQSLQNAYSSLHETPEPALPSTDGLDDSLDVPDQTYSGYAGDPDPDYPGHQASTLTGTEYSTPTDPGSSGGGGMAPGMGLAGDPTSLEPESPSFVSTGSVEDIVAQFQATAGANALMASGGPKGAPSDGMDLAAAAREHLQKAAMATFSPAEQQELIREGEHDGAKAANLDRLEITGTHYEALDALAAADGDDDETWTA